MRHRRSVASTSPNLSFPSSGSVFPFSAQPSAAFASNASSIRSLVLWPTAQGRTPYILRGTKQPCGNERRGKWHRRAKEETAAWKVVSPSPLPVIPCVGGAQYFVMAPLDSSTASSRRGMPRIIFEIASAWFSFTQLMAFLTRVRKAFS